MKIEGERVEIDGITYRVSGSFDLETGQVMPFSITTEDNLMDHLMDGVIEDILTEIVLKYEPDKILGA